ncbi:MAG: hypothetical protein WC688_02260 [Parachlamydiales bacterium]|jgi:hypothetical protein
MKNISHNIVSFEKNYKKKLNQKVFFTGYVNSCRNIGNVIFLLLQDQFGYIQAIIQKNILNRQIINFLTNKRVYISGILRLREQIATSERLLINKYIEIVVDECYLLDDKNVFLSLMKRDEEFLNILKTNSNFLVKNNNFDFMLFYTDLIDKIRGFLKSKMFLEIDADFFLKKKNLNNESKEKNISYLESLKTLESINKNGFNRHFHFMKKVETLTNSTFEIRIGINGTNFAELVSLSKNIINIILAFNRLKKINKIELLSSETAFSLFGSLTPDIRFPIKILDLTELFKKYDLAFFKNKHINCITFHLGDNASYHIEKIREFVVNETENNLQYLYLTSNEIEGPLRRVLPSNLISDILQITKAKSKWVIFFSISTLQNHSKQTLGCIFYYLRLNKLFNLEDQKAAFITDTFLNQNNNQLNKSGFLILNGKSIGYCSLESNKLNSTDDISVLNHNKGFIVLNLRDLENEHKESNFNQSLNPTEKVPNKIYDKQDYEKKDNNFDISIDRILDETIQIQSLEKDEVLGLFKPDINNPKQNISLETIIDEFKETLSLFAMDSKDVCFLIDLLPNKKTATLNLPKNEFFQFLWSLLGHQHVVDILRCKEASILKKLCDWGIITDYRQILLFHKKMLIKLENILLNEKENNKEYIKKFLKILLHNAPNDFSNIISCLADILNSQNSIDEKTHIIFLNAAKKGLSTTCFFKFFYEHFNEENLVNEFISTIKSLYFYILPNKLIDQNQVIKIFLEKLKNQNIIFNNANPEDIFHEIIYYFFRPVNMDLESLKSYFSQLIDYSFHINDLKINFNGKDWDPIEMCYYFKNKTENGLEILKIYPSKNFVSFFAKASSGICTAIDLNLFKREDHFHFNLVTKENRVIGNIQAYVFNNGMKKTLFIRGINPSSNFLNNENVIFILHSVIEACIQTAQNSVIDELLLCPSLGIWHVESSRIEMIAALSIYCKKLSTAHLEKPLLLFNFANQDKYINYGYTIWKKEN